MHKTLNQVQGDEEGGIFSAALTLARRAADAGEVPVGAVVVDSRTGEVIASAHNLTETTNDPTAHAELLAIRAA